MSFLGPGLLSPNRYVLDLSNDVLKIDFGHLAAKNQGSKLDVKKILISAKYNTDAPGAGRTADFFNLQL